MVAHAAKPPPLFSSICGVDVTPRARPQVVRSSAAVAHHGCVGECVEGWVVRVRVRGLRRPGLACMPVLCHSNVACIRGLCSVEAARCVVADRLCAAHSVRGLCWGFKLCVSYGARCYRLALPRRCTIACCRCCLPLYARPARCVVLAPSPKLALPFCVRVFKAVARWVAHASVQVLTVFANRARILGISGNAALPTVIRALTHFGRAVELACSARAC